jgi:hypothetical protein
MTGDTMKHVLFVAFSLSLAFNSFAKCETTLNIKLFSNPLAYAEQSEQYNKIINTIESATRTAEENSGLKVYRSDSTKATYELIIEAGIEKGLGSHDTLLSHFQIVNKKGSVRAEEYRTKKVATGTIMSTDKILKFVKNHLKKELPTCEK